MVRLTRKPLRYRVEHHRDDRSALILAFADTLPTAHLLAGLHRRRLGGHGDDGTVAIVDQTTESVLKRFAVEWDDG